MAPKCKFPSRNYYIVPKVEKLLDEILPATQRPSLLDLEKGASLTLHYGHQFIADGNRDELYKNSSSTKTDSH